MNLFDNLENSFEKTIEEKQAELLSSLNLKKEEFKDYIKDSDFYNFIHERKDTINLINNLQKKYIFPDNIPYDTIKTFYETKDISKAIECMNDEVKDNKFGKNLGKITGKLKDDITQLNGNGQTNTLNDSDIATNSAGLTNKELLLLSNLEYTEITNSENLNKTLGEIVASYDTDNDGIISKKEVKKMDKQFWMTDEELATMMTDVLNDENIKSLTFKDKSELNTLYASTFVTEDNKAVAIFEGTIGTKQWSDNFLGLSTMDVGTDIQEAATNYINELNEKYDYDDITVSGHSKGGNLAQMVAILCPDLVSNCVSFDGQGFTEEWIKNHEEEIENAKDKITLVNSAFDPVNSLLTKTSNNLFFVDSGVRFTDKNFIHEILSTHSPSAMYMSNKDEWIEMPQNNFMKSVNDLSSIFESLPVQDRSFIADKISDLFLALNKDTTIEIEGTNFNVEDYSITKTDKGYNIAKSDNEKYIVATLNNDMELDKGYLKNGMLEKIQAEIKNNKDTNKEIIDPEKYIAGFEKALFDKNVKDPVKLYKEKNLNYALEQLGFDKNTFTNYMATGNKDELLNKLREEISNDHSLKDFFTTKEWNNSKDYIEMNLKSNADTLEQGISFIKDNIETDVR